MKTEIELENKKGKVLLSIQKAELILRAKAVNPSQTWKLPEGSKYTFDGTNLVKKVEPKKEEKKEAE